MSLPWHLTPAADNTLRIDPVSELRNLRYDQRRHPDLTLSPGEERTLHGFQSNCAEITLTIHPNHATRFGLKLCCSPDGQEETVLTYDTRRQQFILDFDRSSLDPNLTYGRNPRDTTSATRRQVVPFALQPNQPLHIDCFIDRSVIELFINSRICIVQRIYPTRPDSLGFRLFTEDHPIASKNISKWEMDATNPW